MPDGKVRTFGKCPDCDAAFGELVPVVFRRRVPRMIVAMGVLYLCAACAAGADAVLDIVGDRR